MIEIDSIVLGHNQFIGVDHLSQESARSKVVRFGDLRAVTEMIRFSSEMGVKGLMVSSHPRMKEILDHLKGEGFGDLNLYPIIPSAQEYIRRFSEKGAMGLLNEMLAPAGMLEKSRILFKGGVGFFKRDLFDLLSTLVDMELLPFKKYPVKAIFLHNVLSDMALGLGNREIFEFWVEHIRKKHNAIPGFATMNFSRMAGNLHAWGFNDVAVMASFNKAGFQMNPSREDCERSLAGCDYAVLAMSTLASGYLKPEEAYEYLFSLPNMRSIVVGASTVEHAARTFGILQSYLK